MLHDCPPTVTVKVVKAEPEEVTYRRVVVRREP